MESAKFTDTIKKPYKRNDGFSVKCLRGLRDIKQADLAEMIGVSDNTMYRIEKMEKIKEPHLSNIANALSVDVDTIANFNTDCKIQVNNPTFSDESQLNIEPVNKYTGVTMEDYKEVIDKLLNYSQTIAEKEREILELKHLLEKNSQ